MVEITLRQERTGDYKQTERVIREAFTTSPVRSGTEYKVVKKLRKESTFNPKYARVAIEDNQIIGHAILSQAYVINGLVKTPILSIGLVSVLPKKQRRGIGTKLIEDILAIAKSEGEKAVIVLGHPSYYPKMGFKRASTFGIELPFDAPDEAFLALELIPKGLSQTSGIVEYPPAFFGT